jgi:hypothetical protein
MSDNVLMHAYHDCASRHPGFMYKHALPRILGVVYLAAPLEPSAGSLVSNVKGL